MENVSTCHFYVQPVHPNGLDPTARCPRDEALRSAANRLLGKVGPLPPILIARRPQMQFDLISLQTCKRVLLMYHGEPQPPVVKEDGCIDIL